MLFGRYVEASWNNSKGEARGKVGVAAKTLPGCSPPVSTTREYCTALR